METKTTSKPSTGFFFAIICLLFCAAIVASQDDSSDDDTIEPFPAEEAKARVDKTTLESETANRALKLTENALLKYNDIEMALDKVSEAWGKRQNGNWFCIRVGSLVLKTKLTREAEQFVFMKIPPIDVFLFKLYDGSSDQVPETEAELIETSRPDANSGEEVYQNNLPDDQKSEAFFAVKWGIQNQNKFGDIEETVKDTMESKFGGEWRCFIMCRASKTSSTSGAGIIDIRKQKIESIEPLLYFGVGKIKALIYKPSKAKEVTTVPSHHKEISYKEYDVIQEARLNIHNVELNQTEMSDSMLQDTIATVKHAIMTYDTYEAMTKYCRNVLDQAHGIPWECLMGTDGQFWTYFWYKKPFFLNFKIDRIRVLIIKQYAVPRSHG